MPNLSDFASYQDAAKSLTNSPKWSTLPADAQQAALKQTRIEWNKLHLAKTNPEKPSVEPPMNETKAPASANGNGKGPKLYNPNDPNIDPKTGLRKDYIAKQDEGLDTTGKFASKVENVSESIGGPAGKAGSVVAKVLPHDNAQAFIDAYIVGGAVVAPEAELGFATDVLLGGLFGAAGGAIEGGPTGAAEGALKGATEIAGGRAVSGAIRGAKTVASAGLPTGSTIFGGKLASRTAVEAAAKKQSNEDISMIGDWLKERFPSLSKGIDSMTKWKETFHQGQLLKDTTENLTEVTSQTESAINKAVNKPAEAPKTSVFGKKGTPLTNRTQPKATVFSPTQQGAAQDEALASVRGEAPKAPAEAAPKPTVFSQKSADPEKAYAKVKSLQAELKAAKAAQKGSRVMDEIRENLIKAQADARAATAAAKAAKKPVDVEAAVKESQRLAQEGGFERVIRVPGEAPEKVGEKVGGAPGEYVRYKKVDVPETVEPLIKLKGIPSSVANNMQILQAEKVGVPFEIARDLLKKTEDAGWQLADKVDHKQTAVAARSAAIQMEHSITEGIAKYDPKAAQNWMIARVQQRAARALTYLLSSPSITNERGNLVMGALQEMAQSRGVAMDLEASLGPEEAQNFIKMVGKGQIEAQDIPGKPFSTWWGFHVGVIPTMGAHMGQAPVLVGDKAVPYYLGDGKALSMAATLGVSRMIQALQDMVDWKNLPANQAKQRQAAAQ